MERRSFLTKSAAVVGAAAVGRHANIFDTPALLAAESSSAAPAPITDAEREFTFGKTQFAAR